MLYQTSCTGILAEFKLSPHQLRYSQDSIANRFQSGQAVTERLPEYTVCACFQTVGSDDEGLPETYLFTLNNRTLFSAIYNDVQEIHVFIVQTDDWDGRFTGQRPWTLIRVRQPRGQLEVIAIPEAMRAPAPRGHVVIEVDRIINRRPGQEETLFSSLSARLSPYLGSQVEEEQGERSYARVRIQMEYENAVREEIKKIGHERGKRVNIKTVSRVFESPRD